MLLFDEFAAWAITKNLDIEDDDEGEFMAYREPAQESRGGRHRNSSNKLEATIQHEV